MYVLNLCHVNFQIRGSLEDHFGSCGEITRVSIPKDQDGGVKGFVYCHCLALCYSVLLLCIRISSLLVF